MMTRHKCQTFLQLSIGYGKPFSSPLPRFCNNGRRQSCTSVNTPSFFLSLCLAHRKPLKNNRCSQLRMKMYCISFNNSLWIMLIMAAFIFHDLCVCFGLKVYNLSPQLRFRRALQMMANKYSINNNIKIALTREEGENSKLSSYLSSYSCEEIPCIQFALTEEASKLPDLLLSNQFDLIVLTSPQSATTFIKFWKIANKPKVQIVSVGKGTSKVLLSEDINVCFEPSEATGEALSTQLPSYFASKVLYPCSQLADNKIENILQSRGFQCQRLSTYTTVPATWTDDRLQQAKQVDLVTFASPSTIKVWAERVGTHIPAVTIGPTSEKAAIKAGFTQVFSPKEGSQGIEAWANAVHEAIQSLRVLN